MREQRTEDRKRKDEGQKSRRKGVPEGGDEGRRKKEGRRMRGREEDWEGRRG